MRTRAKTFRKQNLASPFMIARRYKFRQKNEVKLSCGIYRRDLLLICNAFYLLWLYRGVFFYDKLKKTGFKNVFFCI